MRTQMKVADPAGIEMTLTVTMPLRSWVTLKKSLPSDYVGTQLGRAISDMTSQAERVFSMPPDDDADE